MAFSNAQGFSVSRSKFNDVSGDYNHQETTSINQTINGSGGYTDEQYTMGLRSSNIAGNQINHINIVHVQNTIYGLSSGFNTTTGRSSVNPIFGPSRMPVSNSVVSRYQSTSIIQNPSYCTNNPLKFSSTEKWLVIFDFKAVEDHELTLAKGQTLTRVKKLGQWCYGNSGFKCGLFPSNYVEHITALSTFLYRPSTQPPSRPSQPPPRPSPPALCPIPKSGAAIALESYYTVDHSEISFHAGDRITEIKSVTFWWFVGTLKDGRRGLFSSARKVRWV